MASSLGSGNFRMSDPLPGPERLRKPRKPPKRPPLWCTYRKPFPLLLKSDAEGEAGTATVIRTQSRPPPIDSPPKVRVRIVLQAGYWRATEAPRELSGLQDNRTA